MLRNAVDKAMWVGRTTAAVIGLAIALAVVFGVASMAFAKNGDPWLLGRSNVATAITSLGGALGVNGPMVRIINNNAGANDTALDLRVQTGEPPMTVNRPTKVTNLNADKVDGSNAPVWAVVGINADHSITLTRSKGVTAASKLDTGVYKIQFDRDVSGCAYSATQDDHSVGFVGARLGPQHAVSTEREIVVSTYDASFDGGNLTPVERSFQVVVYC
jgi:hypothetical protein